MTMERYHRCQHCQDVYLCLTSGGPGYHTNHKNTRYCEGCAKVISDALSAVPTKCERIWEKTDDVTLNQLLDWEVLNNAEADAKNGFVIRRVSSPLFRMNGPNITATQRTAYVKGRDKLSRRYFHYRYWEGEEDKVEITEELELNKETGQKEPWRNL